VEVLNVKDVTDREAVLTVLFSVTVKSQYRYSSNLTSTLGVRSVVVYRFHKHSGSQERCVHIPVEICRGYSPSAKETSM